MYVIHLRLSNSPGILPSAKDSLFLEVWCYCHDSLLEALCWVEQARLNIRVLYKVFWV